MATQVQWRGGSTAEHATFTGAAREVTVDTQKQTLVVHDGSTVGGAPLQKQYPPLGSAAAPTYTFTGDTNTGIYSPGADQVAVATGGTGRLFVNGSGNVGLGDAPSHPLDVVGGDSIGIRYKGSGTFAGIVVDNSSSTGGGFLSVMQNGTQKALFGVTGALLNDTSGDAGIVAETSQGIRLFTNGGGAEKMRITSAGLVGIGTSSPAVNLQVNAASDVSLALMNSTPVTSGNRGNISCFNSDVNTVGTIRFAAVTDNVGTEIQFYTRPAAGSLTQTMTLDSAGRLGIGTASPSTTLSIGASASSSYNGGVCLNRGPSVYNFYEASDGTNSVIFGLDPSLTSAKIGSVNSYPIGFFTGNSERARIDSSGRLLVGTSSAPSSGSYNQFGKLIVQGNTFNASSNSVLSLNRGEGAASITSGEELGVVVFGDSAGNEFGSIQCVADAAAGSGDYPGRLAFFTTADGASSPTERMRINAAGAFKASLAGTYETQQVATTNFAHKVAAIGSHILRKQLPVAQTESLLSTLQPHQTIREVLSFIARILLA
jgi:hypothetical protein